MPELEKLITEQNANAVALQQAINNYKKSPIDRKTTDYIERKEKDLDSLWAVFQKVDHRLRNDLPEKHFYFSQDLYKVLGEKYNAVKSTMESDLQKAGSTKSTSTAEIPAGSTNPTSIPKMPTGLPDDQLKQKKVIDTVQRMIQEVLSSPGQTTQFYNLKLKTIEQHWRHAHILHERLLTSTSVHYDFEEFCRYEESINEGMLQIQELMYEEPPQSNMATTNNASGTNFRLPKIELPKFDGNYLNWRNFYDLFSELVDKTTVPNCQKLLYLKSSLTGEAKLNYSFNTLLQHLQITVLPGKR